MLNLFKVRAPAASLHSACQPLLCRSVRTLAAADRCCARGQDSMSLKKNHLRREWGACALPARHCRCPLRASLAPSLPLPLLRLLPVLTAAVLPVVPRTAGPKKVCCQCEGTICFLKPPPGMKLA